MASSRFVLPALAVILLAGGGYYYKRTNPIEQLPTYTTAVLAKGSVRQTVTATGQLDAVLSVDVGSQISGLIVKLHADFNTVVKKDQVIAEIDPATYKQKLRQAEADLASTKASNRLQLLNTERTRELFGKSLVTRQELDQAEALLAQSNASLLTREAVLENANVDLARCTIRSPIDGIVISKQTEEGKTVAASLNSPILFTIANDLAKMQITAAVAEADVGSVNMNQSVTFTVDAFPNRSFTGTVTQVRNAPKTVSSVVTYETIISVDNRDLKLRPGMTANVSIIVTNRDNTLRLPNAALRVRLPESAKTSAAAPTPAAATPAAATPAQPVAATPARSGSGERGTRRAGPLGADATPEQREKMSAIQVEVGFTPGSGPPTPEQREQMRKLMIERGLIPAEAPAGENTVVTRNVYRLPDGNKTATPEQVSVKVGITDGIATEVVSGLNEGDTVIIGVTGGSTSATTPPVANPFSGQRRF